jgi:hypothetical protein
MRLEIIDEMARDQGLEVPLRVGNYALDNVRFFAPRIKFLAYRGVTRRPLVYRQHWYLNRPQQAGKGWLDFNTKVAGRLAGYDENVSHNLSLFGKLISDIRERTRLKIVLVEHPINPKFVREFMSPDLVQRYSAHMSSLAVRLDLPVIDMVDAARLEEEEFYDWCHLRDRDAIARCAAAVADETIPLLIKGGDK